MFAKGRLLGLQFIGLFEDGLYDRVGKHAIALADKLRAGLKELKLPLYQPNTTNQIFVIMEDTLVAKMANEFSFSYIERVDATHSVMRICTSWATTEEQVDALLDALKRNLS